MYQEAIHGMYSLLLTESIQDHILYLREYHASRRTNTMNHLSCFLPGVLILGAEEGISDTPEQDRLTAYRLM